MTEKDIEISIKNDFISAINNSIDTLYDIKCIEYVSNVVKLSIHSMVQNVLENNIDTLIHQLDKQRKSRNRISKIVKQRENKSWLLFYNLGKYDGVYSTMTEIVEKNIEYNDIDKIMGMMTGRKHLMDIILFVHDNPLAQHKEICSAVDVKPNYLNELMTTLYQYGLINKHSQSKYSHYTLTGKGEVVYERSQKKKANYNYKLTKTYTYDEYSINANNTYLYLERKFEIENEYIIKEQKKYNYFENYNETIKQKNIF